MRLLGVFLVVVGIFTILFAFTPYNKGEVEGVVVIFPFIFGNISNPAALISSFLFLAIFVVITLIPWFLTINKKGWMVDFNRSYWENKIEKGSDVVDYIITTELPDSLRKTIYIEENGDEVHLKSNQDDSFHRKYRLPEDFQLDEFDYEYEGKFLILKLKLKKSI